MYVNIYTELEYLERWHFENRDAVWEDQKDVLTYIVMVMVIVMMIEHLKLVLHRVLERA